ncbi:MAG TPA: hypothetical protein VN698_14200 [Bacteroidia bacterium]|nr:hypothetical protein [Bacteroidia bacterium]
MKLKHIDVKKGDTFARLGRIAIANAFDGGYEDLTGWTAQAQLRRLDYSLISTLNVTIGARVNAKYFGITITCPASETANWAEGEAIMDIEFTSPSSEVQSSPTFIVNILRDVTDV